MYVVTPLNSVDFLSPYTVIQSYSYGPDYIVLLLVCARLYDVFLVDWEMVFVVVTLTMPCAMHCNCNWGLGLSHSTAVTVASRVTNLAELELCKVLEMP